MSADSKITFSKIKFFLILLILGSSTYFIVKQILPVLFPFLIAFVLAYLFNPAVNYFESLGSKRFTSSLNITITLTSLFVILCVSLTPILYSQFISLVNSIPSYLDVIDTKFLPFISKVIKDITGKPAEFTSLNQNFREIVNLRVSNFSSVVLSNTFNSGMSLVKFASLAILTPVLFFYILNDFNKTTESIKNLVPLRYNPLYSQISLEIRQKISLYFKGQMYIMLFLSLLYSVLLSIANIDYAFLIGVSAGVFSIIPYVGVSFCMAVGVMVAMFQYNSIYNAVVVLIIFGIGITIDGLFLTPRIIGNKIGVHPVWIIFGFLSWSVFFGFFGVLFAVPLTILASILLKNGIKAYQNSSYFKQKKKRQTASPSANDK